LLSLGEDSWLKAITTTPYIVQNKKNVANQFRKIFDASSGKIFKLHLSEEKVVGLELFDSNVQLKEFSDKPMVTVVHEKDEIILTLFHSRPGTRVLKPNRIPLTFRYKYIPQLDSPIHEILDGKNNRVKDFYRQLWLIRDSVNENPAMSNLPIDKNSSMSNLPKDKIFKSQYTLKREDIEKFMLAVGRPLSDRNKLRKAPFDFAIVCAWESLIGPLFFENIEGNILELVHLSNQFKKLPNLEEDNFFHENEIVDVEMRIHELSNNDMDQIVCAKGTLGRQGKPPLVEITSEFIFLGKQKFSGCFKRLNYDYIVECNKKDTVAIIRSKEYLKWSEGKQPQENDKLLFKVQGIQVDSENGKLQISVNGDIFRFNGDFRMFLFITKFI